MSLSEDISWHWAVIVWGIGILTELAAWLIFEISVGAEETGHRREQRCKFYIVFPWIAAHSFFLAQSKFIGVWFEAFLLMSILAFLCSALNWWFWHRKR